MIIAASAIEQSGPGVDLSNQTDGVSIQMSDPVADFEYARNAVTLVFDLSGVEHVRLAFQAMEFGDEPHAPPPGPFGDDVNFDGVVEREKAAIGVLISMEDSTGPCRRKRSAGLGEMRTRALRASCSEPALRARRSRCPCRRWRSRN